MTFKGHSRSSEMSQFDRALVISYCRSIVTTVLSCIVGHGHADIGRKPRNLYTTPVFNGPVPGDPVGISQRCLIQEKIESLVYYMLKRVYDNIVRFSDTIPERDRRSEGQTDGRTELLYQTYKRAIN